MRYFKTPDEPGPPPRRVSPLALWLREFVSFCSLFAAVLLFLLGLNWLLRRAFPWLVLMVGGCTAQNDQLAHAIGRGFLVSTVGPRVQVQTFPGLAGMSPGLEALAEGVRRGVSASTGPVWIAHSAGAATAASPNTPNWPPRVLVLLDPWPQTLTVPQGPEFVFVLAGREARVGVWPGTVLVQVALTGCPMWNATGGHLAVCARADLAEQLLRWVARPPPNEWLTQLAKGEPS